MSKMINKEQGMIDLSTSEEYGAFLREVKERISQARVKAAFAVNRELIELYWSVGSEILRRQELEGWGAKVIELLSRDLRSSFPDLKGFSRRSLHYMVRFAKEYPELEFVQQVAAQIPWGHNMILLDKLDSEEERLWYAKKTLEHGWSRSILETWIDSSLYERAGKAISNFDQALPQPEADLAKQTLKDPYCFSFLALEDEFREQELERGLLDHIQQFLVELGTGFAFVGRQVSIEVEGEDHQLDLLFYHLQLRCYCVVELKATDFKPEYVGKLNFYINAVDDLLRHEEDRPTIGMLLCRSKKQMKVEYALRGLSTPIGVSGYKVNILKSAQEELERSLPSAKQIEAALRRKDRSAASEVSRKGGGSPVNGNGHDSEHKC